MEIEADTTTFYPKFKYHHYNFQYILTTKTEIVIKIIKHL